MKIKEISLFEYGKFNTKNVFKLSENRPNLIFGRNEAGKSTIVASIIELIFGFERAKKDNHRYLPWNGERLNVEMSYLNDENKEFIVKRLLSNNVKSSIQQGLEVNSRVANNTIPEVEFMSRNIYKNVYMITSEQLKEIETKSFNELQDKLVLNYGNSNVSPKVVISGMEEDLKNIYNPKSRGNKQKINQLMDEVKDLKRDKKDKLNLYNDIRVMREDIEKLNSELDELNEKILGKVKLKNQINQYLTPLHLIHKMDNLKSNVENYDRYLQISDDILVQYDNLNQSLIDLKKQIEDKEERIQFRHSKLEKLSKDENISLGFKSELTKINELEAQIRKASDSLEILDEFLTVNSQKLKDEASYLFDQDVDRIERFDFQEIQTLYYKSKEENSSQSNTVLTVIKVMIILGLLAVGVLTQNIYGTVVLGITLLIVIFDIFDRRAKSRNKSEEALKASLKELGVKDTILNNFTEINLKNLESLHGIKLKNDELIKKRELSIEKILTLKSEHEGIFEVFDSVGNFRSLNEVLTQAIAKNRVNDEIEESLAIERVELEKLERKCLEIDHELNIVKKTIQKLGDNNFDKGYQNIMAFLPIRERMMHYETELSESFNVAELREEIKTLDESMINEDYLAIVENDIETLQIEKNEKGKRNVQLKTEIDHKITGDTLDVIDGKIAYKEEEIKKYSLQYDLLSIVHQAVKRGDERYREKNQPDVLRLTSHYFKVMTNDEYVQVLIEDNNKMYIKDKDGELISADLELSAGTKNQLYLSFRLALIKYLDQGKEKLPVILDEAFSNWDHERLESTLNLLDKIAHERQVILLTCKENNVRALETYMPTIQKIVI